MATGRATRSLCLATKLLSAGHGVERNTTHSALHHKEGGDVLLRGCFKLDCLVIRVAKKHEINAITLPSMKREIESPSQHARGRRGMTNVIVMANVLVPTQEGASRHMSILQVRLI